MNLLLLGIHDLAQYESCGDRKDDVADEFFISRALLGGDDSVADDVRAPDCERERERSESPRSFSYFVVVSRNYQHLFVTVRSRYDVAKD